MCEANAQYINSFVRPQLNMERSGKCYEKISQIKRIISDNSHKYFKDIMHSIKADLVGHCLGGRDKVDIDLEIKITVYNFI